MIELETINLNNAKAIFALANVPMYISRKLREDASTLKIARDNSSEEIEETFLHFVRNHPESLRDQVIPFVLAVALAVRQDRDALERISLMDLSTYDWLCDVVSGLLGQTRANSAEAVIGKNLEVEDIDSNILGQDEISRCAKNKYIVI